MSHWVSRYFKRNSVAFNPPAHRVLGGIPVDEWVHVDGYIILRRAETTQHILNSL